ncbi:NB-ARC domain-containing protein [Nodosilinea sp. FACHB-13]|uniref:NB-ARC domain-containing protein n=1 Tax=Cyanophyceae TaxID=3028117 RepID=UPI001684ABBC|nr:NB-ARC domain-containing protein [Nodosilinea sp. FACHB-13]MBD2110059.1 ATP-binding protein [Nodosilinea sp. FACHB-13]
MALTPQARPRHRKVIVLTESGFQKVQTAKSQSDIWDEYTKTCTLETLSERTGLSSHTLSKVHARKAGVDLRTLVRYFSAFGLTLEASDYISVEKTEENVKPEQITLSSEKPSGSLLSPISLVNWGTAPDVSRFCGRTVELATLQAWILEHQCRLITLSGMGGVGKTWLSVKLLEQIQTAFDVIIWRSLRPISRTQPLVTVNELLDDWLRHLVSPSESLISETTHAKILQLIDCLQKRPCLLVLDNIESVLTRARSGDSAEGNFTSRCQVGYEAYDELFRLIGQGRHQSCLILTSREEPNQLQPLSGEDRQIRLFPLGGLKTLDIKQMFDAKGCFQGSADEWHHLVNYYGGNPFILETIATTIQQLFGGRVADFMTCEAPLLDDICELIDQQFGLLSEAEKAVIGALASQAMPRSFSELRSQVSPSISTTSMLSVLNFLRSRSLLEKASTNTVLPSLPGNYVRDYVNEHFVQQ